MKPKAAVLALLLAASIASAATRQRVLRPPQLPSAATVTGTVSSVAGNIINVANGTVSLDASGATIVDLAGKLVSLSSLTTGTLIVATVKSDGIAPGAPIPATLIAVTKPADVTLTGPATAVDVLHNTLTLLGRTIQVTPQTSFGGPFFGTSIRGVADIQPNDLVSVQANQSGAQLVAVSVLVLSLHVEQTEFIHGSVRSIAADAWVVNNAFEGKDVTVAVNAQTQIVGSPKVGDTVDVLAHTDSSGKLVALSIIKSLLPIFQLP
jgi:Domain of unknown function (DUF5666)